MFQTPPAEAPPAVLRAGLAPVARCKQLRRELAHVRRHAVPLTRLEAAQRMRLELLLAVAPLGLGDAAPERRAADPHLDSGAHVAGEQLSRQQRRAQRVVHERAEVAHRAPAVKAESEA